MKYTAKRPGILLFAALAALLAGGTVSCDKSEAPVTYEIDIMDLERNEVKKLEYGIEGGTQDFLMYSNYGHWTLEPTYVEDLDWLSFWPTEGDGDARFSTMIEPNTTAYTRDTELNVVVDGKPVATIKFTQTGAEPTLTVNVKESGRTVSVKGETFSVGVTANIAWVAELKNPEDASWVTIGDYTETSQSFTVKANSGATPREAVIKVTAYGTQLSKEFTIYQADMSSAFEVAEKKTIAEVLARSPGKISDNIYIVGSVVSDRATRNYPVAYSPGSGVHVNNTMIIQDDTAGLWIEFDSEEDNLYDLNQVVTIHMYGQVLERDSYTNGLKIADLSATAVQSAEAGIPVQPVVLEDVSQLSNYENRLVTLKSVEFALPYGNLVNINEAGYLGIEQSTSYSASWDYNDLTIEYGHFLRDRKGNTTKLYTTWSFTERAFKMIPEGAGDITGIVGKRYKCNVYDGRDEMRRKVDSWCIRIRREADITNYGAAANTRLSSTIMQIGPWNTTVAMPTISASVGRGQLRQSIAANVQSGTTAGTGIIYYIWGHVRNKPATYDPATGAWSPTYGNNVNVQYVGIATQGWWKNGGDIYSNTEGGCWILSNLSTAGYNGQISLQFTASSNTAGPMYFQLEWAENDGIEGTGLAAVQPVWNKIGEEYVMSNWHSCIHAPEYHFVLPDALKNKESFALRMRATRPRNASDNSDDGPNNGVSRIGIIRMSNLDIK